jgi:hypothetical protein
MRCFDLIGRHSATVLSLVALTILGPATRVAHGQDRDQTASPEIKRTTDAFLGHWTMTGTLREPNARDPLSLTSRMDCELTALGKAVTCHVVTDGTDGGRMELTSVIGFSPDERIVRLMEISSSGSYHDHRGRWHGTKIVFDPLTYSVSGRKTTEHFSIGVPAPGKLTIESTEEGAGGKSTMELAGTRLPPS